MELGWGLLGAVVGWVAAQVTAVIRDFAKRWWLKKMILDEVTQLHEELPRVVFAYERAIQMHGAGYIEPKAPLPLGTFIFSAHYAQAAPLLTRVQRVSVELIYAFVSEVNRDSEQIRERLSELSAIAEEDPTKRAKAEAYLKLLRAGLMTLEAARWHIVYHLNHPKFPVLEFKDGEVLNSYHSHLADTHKRIERLVSEGEGMSLEDFNPHLDPQ